MKFSIWSGSSVLKKPLLKSGLRSLGKLGFECEMSKAVERYSVANRDPLLPFIAGNDKLKLQELLRIIAAPENRFLLATRGGYGCVRLLKELDKTSIERTLPLHVWGYSDLTVLQLYLWQRKGWAYVQGPLLGSDSLLAPSPKERNVYANIARFGIFPSVFPIRPLDKLTLPRDPKLLLGGNLAMIVSMLGTPWEPNPSAEYILFLEDIGEPAYKCDRLLQQLLHSRFFDNCRGIVLGHFTNCPDYKKVFKSFSRINKIAVYTGLPMGHQAPRIPIVMGLPVVAQKDRLVFSAKPFGES